MSMLEWHSKMLDMLRDRVTLLKNILLKSMLFCTFVYIQKCENQDLSQFYVKSYCK